VSSPHRIAWTVVPLLALVMLGACTDVADFGAYWDRGTLDPALAGRWKKIGRPGEPVGSIPGSDLVVFTRAAMSYSLQLTNPVDDPALDADARAQRLKDNDARLEARTLRLGGRNFLMVRADGGGQGAIERYEIKGDVLEEWWLYPQAAEEWLAEKHPNARSIKRHSDMGQWVTIDKLDDEAAGILVETLKEPSLWILSCTYRKMVQ
jgi:hypothetical protein